MSAKLDFSDKSVIDLCCGSQPGEAEPIKVTPGERQYMVKMPN